jgi:hypothetical protein
MIEPPPGLDSLPEPDRETLTFGPLWSFSLVAGSDGAVDEREVDELAHVVERARPDGGRLFDEVLNEVTARGGRLLAAYAADERDSEEGLRRIAAILDLSWEPPVGDAFKAALHAVGQAVAAASGGLLGLGNPMSAAESAALARAARCLGLDPDPPLGATWPPVAP